MAICIGTNRPNVINGTSRSDIVVGLRGDELIAAGVIDGQSHTFTYAAGSDEDKQKQERLKLSAPSRQSRRAPTGPSGAQLAREHAMSNCPSKTIRRLADGSIDIQFYTRRAT